MIIDELRKIEARSVNHIAIFQGDCLDILKHLNDDTIQLIITSPPYSDQRKKTYGGIHPEEYVDWFLPRAAECKRVLKPSGTFILNIKEKTSDGTKHTYVLELILALIKQGWLWTEEFIWHKSFSYPGRWERRFRDAWERLLQFNKSCLYDIYKEQALVPISESVRKRYARGLGKDFRVDSQTGSGMGVNEQNLYGREMVEPSNVLYLSPVNFNKGHSAAFPKSIPEWFIKVFTKERDVVLDPFAGSGTTLFQAHEMNRIGIGCEINPDYVSMIEEKKTTIPRLLL